MKILPFLISKPYEVAILGHTLKVMRIAFLLDSATNIWEEDVSPTKKEIQTNFLESNDIFPFTPKYWQLQDDVYLIPVDSKKTNIHDFSFYEDGDATVEGLVWRSFFYIHDGQKSFLDSWEYPETIHKYFSNALKVWNSINI